MSPDSLHWHFPLPRCHTGILLGNGVQGLLVWGDEHLHITISRAGFWHHGGRSASPTAATYADVRRLWEAGDEEALKTLFVGKDGAGAAQRPFQLGGGRLVLEFGRGFRPDRAELHLANATLEVTLRNPAGEEEVISIRQSMDAEFAWMQRLPYDTSIKLIPARDFQREQLASLGLSEPRRHYSEDHLEFSHRPFKGPVPDIELHRFTQAMPLDESLSVEANYIRFEGCLLISTALGEPPFQAPALSMGNGHLHTRGVDGMARAADGWWADYWASVPRLALPDAELQHAYLLGLYKMAGMSTPGGVAATLQGPWMEDDAIPPWSNDYHFNINVQLVYGPALPANRAQHLAPLWDMVRAWLPALRARGEVFFGRPGAMMLPHAVDDRCNVIGTFWAGTIDHACTAWVGQMAWLHYRYTLDINILRDIAWPVLTGAFEGYWAMAEEIDDPAWPGGRRLSIPLSTSPEYNGSGLDACGRDPSFQLAAWHCVARALPQAAAILGLPVDPRWAEVSARLPQYTTVPCGPTGAPGAAAQELRIALWQGQDLAQSHRHHSHLASVWPFQTLQPHDDAHWRVIGRSLHHWGRMGAGNWTGWCLPWASILCTRCGLPDAAVAWLKWWRYVFTNVGHGTLHDADFSGAGGGFGDRSLRTQGFPAPSHFREIMQMDAAMAAVTAILEMLVQSREDTISTLLRIPRGWREFHFSGIRTEGAFFVGGEVQRGRARVIRIRSEQGGLLRLRHPFTQGATVTGTGGKEPDRLAPVENACEGGFAFYERDMLPGEEIELTGASL
ncbi:hypothetical protein DB346_07855 [Verrucomicrobia bacterium LW23]|nr:hypothetical protein DB346_07855 [Verrucomicrobia bacterium LW23]